MHLLFKYWEVNLGKVKFNKNRRKEPNDLVNEDIRFPKVLVIDADGTQLGVLSRREALDRAFQQELDLLCVAPKAETPVCKILDYGRYRFEQQKKEREAKKNQHVTEVKPLRLSPVIDQHDFDTKLKQAREWLADGQKVRIDMKFRGRMITRQEVGRQVINEFSEKVSDIADMSKAPNLEGNTMSVTYSPKKGK